MSIVFPKKHRIIHNTLELSTLIEHFYANLQVHKYQLCQTGTAIETTHSRVVRGL